MAGFKEYQMLFQLNASVGSGFQSAFTSGASSIQKMQDQINSLNKTQSDIASYEKQQAAIEKTKAKIDLYQTQLQNLQNATASTSKEEAELANAIAAKEKQLNDSTQKLDEQNAALSETGQRLREAGVDTNDLTNESARLAKEADAVKQAQKEEAESSNALGEALAGAAAAAEAIGIAKGLETVYGALKDCSQASAEFETAMAGVKRTVGGDDAFIDSLGDSFKELSTEIPITSNELAGIATTAGQLGIAQENVETFTIVMAKLATTTDLTADNAATMLAQFANITGTTDYERLGATVAALGDSTATTASKVVEMSQGMAAAASIAGMSETDILAISAAVGSLGIEAASGSTSMSTLISTLYKATQTGDKLEDFASVAGMSASEFAAAWAGDPVQALNAFIQGLNDTERNGKSAVVILDELGIKNVRQTKAILGLASAGDLLTNTIAQANSAWEENSALNEKAAIMYGTTEAKMTMMQNAANNVQIAIGDALNPVLGAAADAATSLLQPIAEFISDNPALVQAITTFVGVLGLATAGLAAYTAITKLAAAASALLTTSMPVLAIIAGVAAGLGALVGVISALTGANGAASKSFDELEEEFESLNKSFEEESKTLDLYEQYKQLNGELETIKSYDGTEVDVDGDIDVDGKEDVPTLKEASEIEDNNAAISVSITESGYDDVSTKVGSIDELVSEETKEILVKIKQEGYSDVNEKVAQLRKDVQSTASELNTEKQKLSGMVTQAQALQSQIESTKNKKLKGQLTDDLDALNSQIEDQQTTVATLEKKYDSLKEELGTTSAAAAELNGKEVELQATKQALIEASGGMITASADETEAFEEQARAAKEAAEANLALIRSKMYENIGEQAKTYSQAVKDSAEAQANYQTASAKAAAANKYSSMTAEEVNAAYQDMLSTLDEMESAEGWTPDNEAYKEAVAEAEDFISLMSGSDMHGLQETADTLGDGTIRWAECFGYLTTNGEIWNDTLADLNGQVAEYKSQMDDADATQTGFIDNLASAISSGAMTEEQVRAMLKDSLNGEADAAETVERIMGEVNAQLEEEAQAAEEAAQANKELADSTDDLNESTEGQQRTVEDIIKDINDLQQAYDDAYQSALESMNGQFDLFEKVKKISTPTQSKADKNVGDYTSALASQEDFVNTYTANYQAAAQAGVDANLLAQLADGSTESAEQLSNLANASKEEIDALNAQWATLQASKENFATTVADITTDFSTGMTELENELAETIAAMDMSSEAGSAAESTINAFISHAEALEGRVYQAYKKIADRAAKALEEAKPNLDGFASGTDYAPSGMAVVGEEGPELVMLRGGEKIFNAKETADIMNAREIDAEPLSANTTTTNNGGTTYTIDFNPTYTITGSANAAELKSVLEQSSQDLRSQIESILDEIETDDKRRKYA